MSSVFRMLDAISLLLFRLACILVAGIVLTVAYDVLSRNLGLPTAVWAVNAVEYAMLHITFLCLPWLVLTRGHVCVEVALSYMSARLRKRWELGLHVIAGLVCFYLAWVSGESFARAASDGSYEVRSFDAPMWTLFATMPLGFGLGGLQFLAFPLRGESFFGAAPESHAGV